VPEVVAVFTRTKPRATTLESRDTRRSWISLALFPLAFVAAFVVGEGLASLLGYPVGEPPDAPWWVVVVAGLPALAIFSLPALLALHFGRRALRQGDQRARAPMTIGVVVAVMFVGVNLVSGLLVALTD
jgi:hypothetical protein